jgi:hypothetical protein
MLCFKEYVQCMREIQNGVMYVRLGTIQASAYGFRNLYFFCNKMESSVFLLNQETEVFMYTYLVSEPN